MKSYRYSRANQCSTRHGQHHRDSLNFSYDLVATCVFWEHVDLRVQFSIMQLGGIDIVVLLIRRILRHLDGPRLYASFCRLWKGGEVLIERGVRLSEVGE